MPPVVQDTNSKNGLSAGNKKLRTCLEEACAEIHFQDLWRGQGTIAKCDNVRVDVHSTWGDGGWNIQAQAGKFSFAEIYLSDSLERAKLMTQQGVVNAVGRALVNSATSQTCWSVTGVP